MIGAALRFLLPLLRPLAWPIIKALAVFGVYVKGRSDASAKARADGMRADLDAHERINDADTGAGASDADNRRWLRDYADRNRRR